MNYDLVLQNAEVFYEGQLQKLNLGITDQKIVSIEPHKLEGRQVLDLKNKFILPGLIDSQVHFREPGVTHKEDLGTGMRSALAGGITAVLEMPNTKPSTITAKALQEKVRLASEKAWVDFGFFMGAAHENVSELPKLEKTPGCCGIKIFMGSSTGSLLLDDDSDLEKVFATVKCPIAVHCEDERRLVERKPIADKAKDPKAHPEWRDEESAFIATKRVVELSKKYNKTVHILHISSKKEILYLKENKAPYVTVECTPQHLFFAAPECYDKLGTYAQMNPPIRGAEHRQALVEALAEGTVDVIGSDHAPHTKEEKALSYPNSPSGMPGVQTIATVLYDFVRRGVISIERYVDLLCTKPASIYRMPDRGEIKIGLEANLSVLDPNQKIKFTHAMMESKCGWTPFDGYEFTGTPTESFLRGQLVMQQGKILGGPQGKTLRYQR